MTIPLLQTKFYAPPLRQNLLLRPRLLDKLNGGQNGKVTLVAAPAGFGKTTVVCAWLQQSAATAAWLSLDANDNDLLRFLHYFIEAIHRATSSFGSASAPSVDTSFGETTLTLLNQRRLLPQEISIELLLTTLVNELAAIPNGFANGLILVLDDYHLIEEPAIHSALTFVIDHLPRHLHLVITSRANPPLPLARLRAQGQLNQLRAADLRFTQVEVGEFFQSFAQPELLPEQLAILTERTEGWIAGLQLAALSLEQRGDVADFIQNFSGSDLFILDYLIEEVLDQRPAEVQRFLLYTSILGQMCAPLCAWVTESLSDPEAEQSAWLMLQQLAQANLFIIPLDNEQRWYRYHHLFAEMLRQRLRQTEPQKIALLHQRASLWFEEQGLMDEAIQHAWDAAQNSAPNNKGIERVARLVEQAIPTLIMHSYFDKAIQWMAALPAAMVESRPRLSLAQAWLRMLEIPIGDVEESLGHAESALVLDRELGAEARNDLVGEIAAVCATLAGYSGQPQRALALAQEALRLLGPNNHFIRSTVAYMLVSNDPKKRGWEQLQESFLNAIRSAQAGGNLIIGVAAFYNLAMLQAEHGDLEGANYRLQEAERFARSQPNLWPWPIVDSARVGMGRIAFERNDLAIALQLLQEGIYLAKQRRNLYIIIDGCVALAWLQRALGDRTQAQEALQQAIALLPKTTRPTTRWMVMENQVRLWLLEGRNAEAKGWAKQEGIDLDASSLALDKGDDTLLLLVARILVAEGAEKAALALIYLQRLEVNAVEWPGRMIPLLLLQAVALEKLGREGEANERVARALALGDAGGYLRLFVDEGDGMARLLAHFPTSPYRDRVLAAFGVADATSPASSAAAIPGTQRTPARIQPRVEPLSERELEVMRMVVTGASNKEIADHFVITVGTVKNHMSNILGKLGARNRWEARERVEELGLLE